MSQIKVGDAVKVVFKDHAQNTSPSRFRVFGEITEVNKDFYAIHAWMHDDPIERAADTNLEDNEHYFTIVKKAIRSIELMKCVKPSKR